MEFKETKRYSVPKMNSCSYPSRATRIMLSNKVDQMQGQRDKIKLINVHVQFNLSTTVQL